MRRVGGWIAYLAPMVLVAIVAVILFGCGVPAAPAATDPADTVEVGPPPVPTIRALTTPAVATFRAEAVVERTTIAPDPCAVAEYTVNALPYEWLNLTPIHDAYRLVAQNCLGWPADVIDKWEAFIVEDVIRWESGGCWNLLRKGVVNEYLGCVVTYPRGAASDAGLFQIVGSNYAPGTWLCEQHGICSRENIIDSPYNSMRAGLLFVMYDGSRPWCFNAGARSYHRSCGTVPRYWP